MFFKFFATNNLVAKKGAERVLREKMLRVRIDEQLM